MVKREDMFFVPGSSALPSSPPGFLPVPPRDCASTAAADIPVNPETAFVEYRVDGSYRKRSVRKRSQPKFYRPTATRPRASAVVPNRKGRPPKGGWRSEPSSKETTSTTPNSVGMDPQISANAPDLTASQTSKVDYTKVDYTLVLEAINKKHGHIAQDCILESESMRDLIVLGVCKVVVDLEKKKLNEVNLVDLDSYYAILRDAENMKVNVSWLRERLDEIQYAVKFVVKEEVFLVNEKNKHLVNIGIQKQELELRRGELERLRSKVEDLENRVAREEVKVEQFDLKISAHQSRISKFQHGILMDWLI